VEGLRRPLLVVAGTGIDVMIAAARRGGKGARRLNEMAKESSRLCTFVCPPPSPAGVGASRWTGQPRRRDTQLLEAGSRIEQRGWTTPRSTRGVRGWRGAEEAGRGEDAAAVIGMRSLAPAVSGAVGVGMTLRGRGTVTTARQGSRCSKRDRRARAGGLAGWRMPAGRLEWCQAPSPPISESRHASTFASPSTSTIGCGAEPRSPQWAAKSLAETGARP